MNVTQFRNICFASFFGCSNRKNRTHRTHHRFTFTQTTESFPNKIACKTIIITIKLVYFKYFLCTFVAFDSIAFPAFVVASNAVWVVVFMCCSRFTESFHIRSENFHVPFNFERVSPLYVALYVSCTDFHANLNSHTYTYSQYTTDNNKASEKKNVTISFHNFLFKNLIIFVTSCKFTRDFPVAQKKRAH